MTRRTSIALLLLVSAGSLWAQKNVVSLSGPMTEAIYALGAQDRLAGVTDSSVFPAQVMSDRQSGKIRMLGSFSRPDLAAIDSIHPTLILTSTAFQRELASSLRAKGYNVLHFEPTSLDAIMANIDELGAAIGKRKEAAKYTAGMRRELAEIVKKSNALPRVKVYLEINHAGPWTHGAKSPLNDSIRAAGGENIFADVAEDVMVVKNEEVVRRNPDVILSPIWLDAKVGGIDGITTLFEVMSRPSYSATTAVRNSRVLYYDSALLKWEGPRQILAIRKLAYLLHPDAFSNPPDTLAWELGRIRQ